MKAIAKHLTLPAGLASAVLFSACGSIGDGNGPVSLELFVNGDSESGEVFRCQINTPSAILTFDNGTASNFASRATWTSSNPSVLAVSNGDYPAPDDQFFVSGVILPIAPGSATLTVNYLDFEDSIEVTVSETDLSVTPKNQTLIQGQSVFMSATGVLHGETAQLAADFSSLGQWSVVGEDDDSSASTIDSANGLLTARDEAEGVDRVEFRIDFCDTTVGVDVSVLNQTLDSIELVRADDRDSPLSQVSVPPDASVGLRAIGHFSGGFTQDMTSRVLFSLDDDDVGFAGLRGAGVITSLVEAGGSSAQVTATFDPDSEVEGDETVTAPITLNVLDVTLDPASLDIQPRDALMLQGSSLAFSVTGEFSGPDGDVTWDLTRDVVWASDEPTLASVLNTNGSRGIALSSTALTGAVEVSALRVGGDGPEEAPATTLIVGSEEQAEDGEEIEVAEVYGLTVEIAEGEPVFGQVTELRAVADIGIGQAQTTQDITTLVVWTSSDPEVAYVGNQSGGRGVVSIMTQEMDQNVTITARYFDEELQARDVIGTIELLVNPSPEETPAE